MRVYLAPWREHLGLTQQQVGDLIDQGVDKGTVSRWENARRVPSINVVAAYAEALGIPVGNLYRKPTDRLSLDDLVADAPDDVRRKAAEVVSIMVRTSS